jgi:hypothetical protein
VLSALLSRLGLKSRVWALENERFNGIPHSIVEAYCKEIHKWVFIDPMFGFYVTKNGQSLSLLELREALLGDSKQAISLHTIGGAKLDDEVFFTFYRRLIKTVFLRADNDFTAGYKGRYGLLSVYSPFIDRLPDYTRRGISYFLGKRDVFIHYVDTQNRSLKNDIRAAKLIFYFFISTLSIVSFFVIFLGKSFLRRRFSMWRSKKDTRQT